MATNFLPAGEVILSGSAEAHFDRLLQVTLRNDTCPARVTCGRADIRKLYLEISLSEKLASR